jgi:hypothetical protein
MFGTARCIPVGHIRSGSPIGEALDMGIKTMSTTRIATLALVAALAINSAYAETCSGELAGDYSGTAYGLGGCGLRAADAK